MTPYADLEARKRHRRRETLECAAYAVIGAATLALFQWLGI